MDRLRELIAWTGKIWRVWSKFVFCLGRSMVGVEHFPDARGPGTVAGSWKKWVCVDLRTVTKAQWILQTKCG